MEIDHENEGGETFICGNPPYAGLSSQNQSQKQDLEKLFGVENKYWKSYDYVCGWVYKAAHYIESTDCLAAFVTTNSICQGQQVPMFWPLVISGSISIRFAYASFKWSNLAAYNAGVTVVIIGLGKNIHGKRVLFSTNENGGVLGKAVDINRLKIVPTLPHMLWSAHGRRTVLSLVFSE